jgi:hypothetical protein
VEGQKYYFVYVLLVVAPNSLPCLFINNSLGQGAGEVCVYMTSLLVGQC